MLRLNRSKSSLPRIVQSPGIRDIAFVIDHAVTSIETQPSSSPMQQRAHVAAQRHSLHRQACSNKHAVTSIETQPSSSPMQQRAHVAAQRHSLRRHPCSNEHMLPHIIIAFVVTYAATSTFGSYSLSRSTGYLDQSHNSYIAISK
jgi:hypothetical protein